MGSFGVWVGGRVVNGPGYMRAKQGLRQDEIVQICGYIEAPQTTSLAGMTPAEA